MRYKTEKLGKFLYIKGRIGWKGLKKSEYLEHSEYKIINGESLTKNGIDWDKAGYISKERYDESPEIMLQNNDILISKDGTIGKLGFVENLSYKATVASGIFVLRNLNSNIINTRFIYNYLSSIYFSNFIISRTEGSVIPRLYQKDVVELDFPLPSLEIQEKIVEILDAISLKIKINNLINNNLEQQAFAIFNDMFEQRESNGKLADIILENPKSKIKVGDAKEAIGKYPFFTSGQAILKYKFPLISGRNCYLNTGGNADVKFFIGEASYSTDTWCISGTGQTSDYLYLLLKCMGSELNDVYFEGSALKHLQKQSLKDRDIYIPSVDELKQLNGLIIPMFDLISKNDMNSSLLIKMRDSLLPKLMSGELDVSNLDI